MKRYMTAIRESFDGQPSVEMIEMQDGDWVLHEDAAARIAALEAEKDRIWKSGGRKIGELSIRIATLEAENARMREAEGGGA